MLRLFILSFFILIQLPVFAQEEYLVEINPNDGSMKKIAHIPVVGWIRAINYTYNEDKKEYTFIGYNKAGEDMRLYTVSAAGGGVVSQPQINLPEEDNPANFIYDPVDKVLCGIYWNAARREEYFVKVNTVTGSFDSLSIFPEVHWILPHTQCLNVNNHSYSFIGSDSFDVSRIYTVDIDSRVVTASSVYEDSMHVRYMTYDKFLDRYLMICDVYVEDGRRWFLFEIDINTAEKKLITEFPINKFMYGYSHTYNNKESRLLLVLGNMEGVPDLYTISGKDGAVVHKTPIDRGRLEDNLVCFEYDTDKDRIIALFWEDSVSNVQEDIDIYPNPWRDVLTIDLKRHSQLASVRVTDAAGKTILILQQMYSGIITLQRPDVATGIYYITVMDKNTVLATKRVWIER